MTKRPLNPVNSAGWLKSLLQIKKGLEFITEVAELKLNGRCDYDQDFHFLLKILIQKSN